MNIKLFIGAEQADFNEVFNVLFSIGDIRESEFGNSNKTYTLNIPLTKTNKRLLSYITQTDVRTEPSAIGRLYFKEILIIEGAIQVMDYQDYYAKILISSDDWIDALKTTTLRGLDLSAHDHVLTNANVEASWSASYPAYRYPLIDFGALQSGENGSTAKWWPTDFIPMIAIKTLIDKILAPYTISSTWLNTAFAKNLFILANEQIASENFMTLKGLEVKGQAPTTDYQDTESIVAYGSGTAALSNVTLLLKNEIIDEGSDYEGNTGEYTVPETGTYRITGTIISYANSDYAGFTETGGSFQVDLLQTGSASRTLWSASAARVPVNTSYPVETGYVHLVAGDIIKFRVNASSTCTNNTALSQDLVIGINGNSTWTLKWGYANLHPGIYKSISLEEMLPDMTHLDFLAAIRNIFNLKFWMDKQKRTIYIEPWQDFISSTVVDLTSFINFESIQAEMISQNYSKKIRLMWKADQSDQAYVEYFRSNIIGPGYKDVDLTSLYAKQGRDDRESYFSTMLTGLMFAIGNQTLSLPRIWAEEQVAPYNIFRRKVGFNTRLVQWDGLSTGLTWNYDGVTKTNSYPKIEGLDWTNIYNSYWMKHYHYVNQGKLLTMRMKIDPKTLNQFFTVIATASSEGFRPTYQVTIKGINNYFFLQKITSDGEQAEIELILKQ